MMAGTISVLIAEDDEGHATLVRRNLKRAGLQSEPVHVRDGQEALDYLHRRAAWSQRPKHEALAIVLDLNMPRLGGMEVLRHLKATRDVTPIPVFVLTTTDDPLEVERCYSLGASACIVKPIDYDEFSDTIQTLAHFLMAASIPGETNLPRARNGG
jgi:CheY-like chemotaxis protein